MPLEAYVLTLLILLTVVIAIAGSRTYDYVQYKREEKRKCPICQGASMREMYRFNKFADWCVDHRNTWWGPSIWDMPGTISPTGSFQGGLQQDQVDGGQHRNHPGSAVEPDRDGRDEHQQ